MSEVPVQDFLEITSHKGHPHITICGCSHNTNVFNFKALCSSKMWKSRSKDLWVRKSV